MVGEAEELGNILGKSLQEQEDTRRSSTHGDNVNSFLIFPNEVAGNFKDWNLVVKTKTITDGFILGNASFGILGTSKLGEPSATFIEAVRRRWVWDNQTELAKGTKSSNIDITNGDIRLA